VSRDEARYEIRVGGRLGDLIRSAFPELRARAQGGDTILSGVALSLLTSRGWSPVSD
jgi:hypothetical protein